MLGDELAGRGRDVVALVVGVLDQLCGCAPVGLVRKPRVEVGSEPGPPLGRGPRCRRLEPLAYLVDAT